MNYIKPEIEVVEFELADVIQTSAYEIPGGTTIPETEKDDALPVG